MENAAPQAKPGFLRKALRWLWQGAAIFLVALAVLHVWPLARIVWWRTHNPQTTAFMQQGLQRLQEKNPKAQIQQQWVPYERISLNLKRAVIAAEDQKFLDHEGFDWEQMEKAFEANQRRGRIRRGGSTISQQLAKNLFLSAERSYLRKGEEAILTTMIELLLEKRRILEIYLNVIEWGDGLYGAEAAARYYYGASAASLNLEQSTRLAAMIPNPRYYYRRGVTPYLEQRASILQTQMSWVQAP